MAVVTFDTLKFVKTLQAAGVPPQQAEAISDAVRDSHDAADLATKADLREVRTEIQQYESSIRGDLEKLETKLLGETIDLRHDMNIRFAKVNERFVKIEGELTLLKWMLGLVIAGIASLVLKAFF